MVVEFREAIQDCGLMDLGWRGYLFTWSNKRFGPVVIEERLDRFLCNRGWSSLFKEVAAQNEVTWSSDHNPIVMEVVENCKGQRYNRRTFYRVHYEDMWSSYEKSREIIQQEWEDKSRWNRENPVELFKKTSKNSLVELKLWSKKEFGGRGKKLKQVKHKLQSIRQNFSHYESGDEIKKTKQQIDNILLDKEIFWKQTSRADWLKEEDKNTKFFHAKTSSRKRKNKLWGLLDEDGKWTEDASDVERLFCEHFAKLFTSTNPSNNQMDVALVDMPVKVTRDMNSHLDTLFTEGEIMEALAQMCPTKTPGPDGFPAAFFKSFGNQ